jgi:hypothetical protein
VSSTQRHKPKQVETQTEQPLNTSLRTLPLTSLLWQPDAIASCLHGNSDNRIAEHVDPSENTANLYSRGARPESRPHTDYIELFLGSPESFGQFRESYVKKSTSGIWRRIVRWKSADVSEEHIASIFRVEEQAEQEISVKTGGKLCWFIARLIIRP